MSAFDEEPAVTERVESVEPPELCIPIGEFEAVASAGPVMFAGFKAWAGRKQRPLSEWRRLLAQFTGGTI